MFLWALPASCQPKNANGYRSNCCACHKNVPVGLTHKPQVEETSITKLSKMGISSRDQECHRAQSPDNMNCNAESLKLKRVLGYSNSKQIHHRTRLTFASRLLSDDAKLSSRAGGSMPAFEALIGGADVG